MNQFQQLTAEDQEIMSFTSATVTYLDADRADAAIMSRTMAIHEAMRNPGELMDCDEGLPEFNHNLVR